MYIPSIARGIHLGNKRVLSNERSESVYINLAGVAIGNGWIDANVQGPTVIDYAFWHGMIDLRTSMSLHRTWEDCIANEDIADDQFHPFTTPDECGMVGAVMKAAGSENMYDVTNYDTDPNHDGSRRRRRNLLSSRQNDVSNERKLILLLDKDRRSVVPYIAELLDDAKIHVLLYNGNMDLSCRSQSTEMALDSMKWSGHAK
ncbi:hypothetical protein ACHAWF_000307 [Thalassiosira exigua]